MGIAQLPDLPLEPWERKSIDFCGHSIAGFICNLIREAIIIPCKKISPPKEQYNYTLEMSSPGQDYPR